MVPGAARVLYGGLCLFSGRSFQRVLHLVRDLFDPHPRFHPSFIQCRWMKDENNRHVLPLPQVRKKSSFQIPGVDLDRWSLSLPSYSLLSIFHHYFGYTSTFMIVFSSWLYGRLDVLDSSFSSQMGKFITCILEYCQWRNYYSFPKKKKKKNEKMKLHVV